MLDQIRYYSKGLVTKTTFVVFFSAMSFFVGPQAGLDPEALGTKVTIERLFFGVKLEMFFQFIIKIEPFCAFFTFERLEIKYFLWIWRV